MYRVQTYVFPDAWADGTANEGKHNRTLYPTYRVMEHEATGLGNKAT